MRLLASSGAKCENPQRDRSAADLHARRSVLRHRTENKPDCSNAEMTNGRENRTDTASRNLKRRRTCKTDDGIYGNYRRAHRIFTVRANNGDERGTLLDGTGARVRNTDFSEIVFCGDPSRVSSYPGAADNTLSYRERTKYRTRL